MADQSAMPRCSLCRYNLALARFLHRWADWLERGVGRHSAGSCPENMRCAECGADLRPTPEQIEALERFGNPLRRPPCLKTASGLHRIAKGSPC